MKNLLTIIAIAAVALSSCTSSKNGFVMKRKYNKGYYVAQNHKAHNTEAKQRKDNAVINSEDKHIIASSDVLKSINVNLKEGVATSKEVKPTSFEIKTSINHTKHNTILVDDKNITASTKEASIKTKHNQVNIDKKTEKTADSDANLILLVILSLFPILALIAIYLKDGKSITLNFWIDLLLHLLFLYWLFALLVVLDVINLA